MHLNRGSDLLRALIVIQEDGSSEREKQERMSRRLKGNRIDEKDDDLFGGGEEGGDKGDEEGADEGGDEGEEGAEGEEEKGEEGGEDKKPKKGGKLPGAKRLEDAELRPGQAPTTKDIVQRINFVRAGASLKDDKVKRDIATWLTQLKEPERLAVFTTLDALAKIVLAGKSAAEAPTFSGPSGIQITGGEEQAPAKAISPARQAQPTKKQSAGPVPITVGEGVMRKLKEIDVPVRSGRVVPFGSKAHVADLEGRIDDLERIRSYQEPGSDSRHAIGLAIKALKGQLRAAMRRSSMSSSNPRTQPIPPIVEKEK